MQHTAILVFNFHKKYMGIVGVSSRILNIEASDVSSRTLNIEASDVSSRTLNLLKTERILLYIRKQSVPRCKHFPPRL
jgi:hypothetical protein